MVAIAFLPYISQAVDALSTGIAALKAALADVHIPPEVGAAIDQATKGLQAWVSASLSEIGGQIGEAATIGILATFLTFFFMMDGDKAWVWVMSSANAWRRDAITTAGDDALGRVGGYLRGTAVIAAFDAAMEGLFLWILGVPLVLPLAVIVFFGRFIPYVGGLITTLLLLIVTIGTAGTTAAVILLVLIAILNIIQGKFLAPVIYHKTVHIHPAVALIALPAGAALAGIVGLFVAIPVVAFALAIVGRGRSRSSASSRARDRRGTRSSRSGSIAWANGAGGCWSPWGCWPWSSRRPSRSRSWSCRSSSASSWPPRWPRSDRSSSAEAGAAVGPRSGPRWAQRSA